MYNPLEYPFYSEGYDEEWPDFFYAEGLTDDEVFATLVELEKLWEDNDD